MPSDKRFLVLEGSPKERGLIHGETLRPMILEVIERVKYSLRKNYGSNPERLIDRFVKETDFIAAVRKLSPHLLDEVEGISEGAGVDFNTIFFLQCMDEQWWWFPESISKLEARGCSTIGSFRKDESPALLAQNMDIPNMFQGLDVLLHIKHRDSLESYVYTFAGLIALCGVNNRPVGICCNTLIDMNHCTEGYPVAFIVRSVLEQSNLEEAIKFVRGFKHASGQNYTIGDFEEVISLECSAGKISRFVPYEGARRVYHTNHPLANDDIVVPPMKRMGTGTSHARFAYLAGRLRDPTVNITPETIRYILSSHEGPVCVHNNNQPGGGYTFGSLVYILSKPPELHLARGPPCQTEYEIYSFTRV